MQPGGDFADIDSKTTSGARVYDYMLGGTDNYAVDRMVAEQTERMLPGTMAMARNNRRYMERVVRYLARDCGIRQFIDNGSGLPTRNNIHHIAQAIAPESLVIYIDKDPVVLRHQRVSALAENQNTAFVLADGTEIPRDVSECLLILPQGTGHTPVVLGEPGDAALLGVVSLENLGLIFYPFDRTIRPARMLLASAT